MSLRNCSRWATLGALLALSGPLCNSVEASSLSRRSSIAQANARTIQAGAQSYAQGRQVLSAARYRQTGGTLQCVPFARENSGIEIQGNAVTWWNSAAGVYERGNRPEVGSVLNFRATGRMYMGHVAVVSKVIDSRNVEIDQANWSGRGRVSRNIDVVDVSPRNDWTAVRVAVGDTEAFGSVYPTFGFIYDRPDRGTMVANVGNAPVPVLNPAPQDWRPANERTLAGANSDQDEEVAEASDGVRPRYRAASARLRTSKPPQAAIARNVGNRAAKLGHRSNIHRF